MSLESLITTYGYGALFVGTFLEGETILIIGGFLAHQGYLSLPLVILTAFLGTLFGDQLYFFLGRWKGEALLARRPGWAARSQTIRSLLDRYQTLVMLGFRFLYGFRTVTPLVLGMHRVRVGQFAILNGLSALAWAILVGCGGFIFGHALERFLGDLKRYEKTVLLAIGIVGIGLWLIHWRRKRSAGPGMP